MLNLSIGLGIFCRKLKFVLVTTTVFGVLGCAGVKKSRVEVPHGFSMSGEKSERSLFLKGVPGQQDITDYYSRSLSQESVVGKEQITKTEEVDFAVLSTVIQLAPMGDIFYITTETTYKDGEADLRDYGFPEMTEVLDLAITKRAKILLAGEYPQDSVFFVPPIPLPEENVKPGETWQDTYMWRTRNSGVPLKLDVVAILKGYFDHPKFGKTANIEVSGEIEVLGAPDHIKFNGYLNGTILFSADHGKILWSKILNREVVLSKDKKSEASSCMVSKLRGVVSTKGLECDPKSKKVLLSL